MITSYFNSAIQFLDNKFIQDYLLIEKTNLCPADAILVFGNRHCIDKLAQEASRLYHEGYAPKIIATGGRAINDYTSEAQAIKNSLLAYGVDPNDIITEDKSTNTKENILYAKEIIEAQFPDHKIERLIGTGSVIAGRRFLMTLVQNWPEVIPMASNVNPFDTPVNEWETNPQFQQTVIAELKKIPKYIAKGDIKEINMHTMQTRIIELHNGLPDIYQKQAI